MNIGITGFPGSGKSTLAYYLASYLPNCYVPDTDSIYYNMAMSKMNDELGWLYATAEGKEETYKYIVDECFKKGIEVNDVNKIEDKANISLSMLTFLYTSNMLNNKTSQYSFVIIDFYLLPYLSNFHTIDYSILLNVEDSIRYENALKRMSNNEKREFSDDEKKRRIKKMIEFEKGNNLTYDIMDYTQVIYNPSSLDIIDSEAMRIAKDILKEYPSLSLCKMLKKEIFYTSEKIEELSHSYWRAFSKERIKDEFEYIENKIKFLYEEQLIDKVIYKKLSKYCKTNEVKCLKLKKPSF